MTVIASRQVDNNHTMLNNVNPMYFISFLNLTTHNKDLRNSPMKCRGYFKFLVRAITQNPERCTLLANSL